MHFNSRIYHGNFSVHFEKERRVLRVCVTGHFFQKAAAQFTWGSEDCVHSSRLLFLMHWLRTDFHERELWDRRV